MARRRSQRTGYLREEKGSWLLTFRQYKPGSREPERKTVTIGPATGPGTLTKKQAERFAWTHYLEPLDKTVLQPLSTMTVDQYWSQKYEPWLKGFRKRSTQIQYTSLYTVWIKPALGKFRFSDLDPDMVEGLIGNVIGAGKSTGTAKHVRKVIGAIYTRAKRSKVAFGDNPAAASECPAQRPARPRTSLRPEQFTALVELLPGALSGISPLWSHPYREMAFTAAITSMNAAELCGLRWRAVNLSGEFVMVEGETVPPNSIVVMEHWKHGEYTSLKTASRLRVITMPEDLRAMLAALKSVTECGKPEQPVFCSREGTPIDADNVRARHLKPAAEKLGIKVGWHSFRRTHANLTNAAGMNPRDRQELMGHGALGMTDHYTGVDYERMRTGLGEVARMLTPGKERVM